MKYSIETTENGVNETLEVDGNLYKKEWEREVTGLFRCKQKILQTKWKMMDSITSHCLKKLMRSLTASLLVPLTI